ncbi:MAG: CFI-box-CTERM domain-containing protein [Planctomycetota bacterium]
MNSKKFCLEKYFCYFAGTLLISITGGYILPVDVVFTVKYFKRLYTESGLSGSMWFPLRYAKTEILKCQQAGNNCQVVATVETDERGLAGIAVPSLRIGDFISIRFYAKNCRECSLHRQLGANQADFSLEVRNLSNAIFTYTIDFLDPIREDPFGADITIPRDSAGPFNIFTILGAGFEFLYESTATFAQNALPRQPPPLKAVWEPLSTIGTFFQCNLQNGVCNGSSTIFILGSQSDPDEFDDDVILHEFGHYAESNFGRNDSPGGQHSPASAQDLRMSWSEGFAGFFSSWCREWLREVNSMLTSEFASLYTSPHLYIDNKRTGADVLNFETSMMGKGVDFEVSVASILWDIWDVNNELDDKLNIASHPDNYDVLFELFLIFMPEPLANTPPFQTFERFYDNFLLLYSGILVCNSDPLEVCLQVILEQNNAISYVGDFTETARVGNSSVDLGGGEGPIDLTVDPQISNTPLDLTRKTVTVGGLSLYAGEPGFPPSDPMYSGVFTFNCNNPDNPDDISHKCDWEIFKVFLEHNFKYVFETVNLKDGADTVIEVWTTPPDQSEVRKCEQPHCIASNDDIDPSEGGSDETQRKRSRLIFTAPSAGFYYIVVHSYDEQDAVSTYGGYDFKAGPFQQAPPPPAPKFAGGGGGGGCFIASAVSDNNPHILTRLRKFRDNILNNSSSGRQLIKLYYQLARPIARKLKKYPLLKNIINEMLKSFVEKYFENRPAHQ